MSPPVMGALLARAASADEPDDEEDDDTMVEEALQELFLGESVYPQEALELQLTSENHLARTGPATGATTAFVAELGLTDRFQVGVRAPVEWALAPAGAAGFGNASLEALLNPVSSRELGFALSVGAELGLPAPSAAGEDAVEVEGVVVAYHVFGPLHANLTGALGVELGEEETELAPGGALSLFLPVGRWVPLAELGAEAGAEPALLAAGGLLWHPVDAVELGAGVEGGLDAPWVGGFFNATIEFGLTGEDDE